MALRISKPTNLLTDEPPLTSSQGINPQVDQQTKAPGDVSFKRQEAGAKSKPTQSKKRKAEVTPAANPSPPFDFITEYVRYADRFEVPTEMHEAVAIALMAAAVNGKVFFDWGERHPLDIWIMNLSGSGSGRSTAIKAYRPILKKAGPKVSQLDQTIGWGSYPGVIQYFAEHPNGLHVYSEASYFLGHLDEPKYKNLKPWLTDLYDDLNLPRGINAYRKNPNRPNQTTPPIEFTEAPRLTLVTTSSPDWLLHHVSRIDATGGFLSRWIWNYMPEIKRRISKPVLADESLIPPLALHLGRLHHLPPFRLDFSLVESEYDTWYNETADRWEKQPNQHLVQPYWQRHRMHVLKLAAIFEMSTIRWNEKTAGWLNNPECLKFDSDGRYLPVSLDAFHRAVAYLRRNETSLFQLLGTGMSTEGFDLSRMDQFIEASGTNGRLVSTVTLEFRNTDPRIRTNQLKTLYDEGSIRMFEGKASSSGGRKPRFLLKSTHAAGFLEQHPGATEIAYWSPNG